MMADERQQRAAADRVSSVGSGGSDAQHQRLVDAGRFDIDLDLVVDDRDARLQHGRHVAVSSRRRLASLRGARSTRHQNRSLAHSIARAASETRAISTSASAKPIAAATAS